MGAGGSVLRLATVGSGSCRPAPLPLATGPGVGAVVNSYRGRTCSPAPILGAGAGAGTGSPRRERASRQRTSASNATTTPMVSTKPAPATATTMRRSREAVVSIDSPSSYRTVVTRGGRVVPNAAWTYLDPNPGFAAIRGYLGFYAWAVDEAWVARAREVAAAEAAPVVVGSLTERSELVLRMLRARAL